MTNESWNRNDVAASFQKVVVDSLVETAMRGVRDYNVKKFAIAGGVAANTALRAAMEKACRENGVEFYYPSPVYCTDNAAMIAAAGYYEFKKGNCSGWDLNAVPNLKLGER
jgi:N6-L-threonylcarbamoyladenine synthase